LVPIHADKASVENIVRRNEGEERVVHEIWSDMFSLPIPVLEKVIRPVLVYFVLLLAFRIFGRRQLAQLNPMDLTVLLMLSNTIQNAIIGEDNSLIGGVIGAVSLLSMNWVINEATFRYPRLVELIEGKPQTLIENGIMDKRTVNRAGISRQDIFEVLHREGLDRTDEVGTAYLESSGMITIVPRGDDRIDDINARLAAIEELLRRQLDRDHAPAQGPAQ
jgi:uncharacterized membrane protein YcaP (DUF421 family)